MTLMLKAQAISKTFGGHTVLAPLDLELAKGQTLVLLGNSGCGKSTVLKILMGLLAPTTGSVEFQGEVMTAACGERLRRRMGYVIQDGGLFPHMTARDNILLLPRYLKRESEALTYLDELRVMTQLPAACLDRYPAQLSGGQRQRIGLLRALILKPELLLLDEPLGALDPVIRADVQEDLRRIVRTLGKTVVMVTHDLGEAAYFGDEILLLKDGRVLQRGPLKDLAQHPADPYVTRFIRAQRTLSLDFAEGAHP